MKKNIKFACVLAFIFASASTVYAIKKDVGWLTEKDDLVLYLAAKDELAIAQLIMKKSGITPIVALEKVQKKYPAGIVYEYELEKDDFPMGFSMEINKAGVRGGGDGLFSKRIGMNERFFRTQTGEKKVFSSNEFLYQKEERFVHEIKMINLTDKLKYEILVDVLTGDILKEKSTSLASWFFIDGQIEDAEKISKSGFQLKDAIGKIDLEEDMVIKKVELEEELGIQYFEIETNGSNGEKKWLINLKSKSLIPNYSKLESKKSESNLKEL